MVPDWLQKLLILQDRDSRCDTIQRQLEAIPGEISGEEASIKALQAEVEAAGQTIRQLEARRMDLEGEVEQAEAAIVKYKTQQMQVKKNEEYTALEHEIRSQQAKVSDLEDSELLLMEEIDRKRLAQESLRESNASQQKTLEAHIERLKQNYESFAGELQEAKDAVKACEAELSGEVLQQYRYVKGQVKRPPVVVQLDDGRCQGCHLKVSGEVESEARRGDQLVRCDSCGRILYFQR